MALIIFFSINFSHTQCARIDATAATTTNSSSKRMRCSPSPPRHHQQQQQQQQQRQQSPLLQIRRISPNSERHQRSGESPPVSLHPRKINRERERDYNSETGTDDHLQPLRLKRSTHLDVKKQSDYSSSIDDRRSRTPDDDVDDMDEDDDAMSNDHGKYIRNHFVFCSISLTIDFPILLPHRNGNKHDDKF